MSEVLNVEQRDLNGKRNNKRLRLAGKLPAVLYGHGQESVHLSLPIDEMRRALRHGAKLFDLKGSVTQSAIIRQVQWDAFGSEMLHIDFMRVDADERLQLTVEVVLRGTAPGTREGGVVTQMVHSVEIDTTSAAIPEILHLNVNSLQLDQELTAGDIEDMPAGAKLITPPDTVLAHCVLPMEEPEEDLGGEGAEPEVIGRKAEDEEEE